MGHSSPACFLQASWAPSSCPPGSPCPGHPCLSRGLLLADSAHPHCPVLWRFSASALSERGNHLKRLQCLWHLAQSRAQCGHRRHDWQRLNGPQRLEGSWGLEQIQKVKTAKGYQLWRFSEAGKGNTGTLFCLSLRVELRHRLCITFPLFCNWWNGWLGETLKSQSSQVSGEVKPKPLNHHAELCLPDSQALGGDVTRALCCVWIFCVPCRPQPTHLCLLGGGWPL